jgi:hypothetical protein
VSASTVLITVDAVVVPVFDELQFFLALGNLPSNIPLAFPLSSNEIQSGIYLSLRFLIKLLVYQTQLTILY